MPSIFQDVFASSGGKWFNFTNIKGIFWPQPGRNLVKHLKNTVYYSRSVGKQIALEIFCINNMT